MKDEFTYGELVEVRDNDNEEWQRRCYVMTAPQGKYRYVTVMPGLLEDWLYDAKGTWVCPFAQIRKIQPEHDLIEIEQPESTEERLDKFEAILNGAIAHMNEQIASIKKQIK